MIGIIELREMEFYAYHGCFEEEQLIGNKFTVNLQVWTDIDRAAASDNIDDAVDYQRLYMAVKEEMEQKSRLLENVASRIADRVKSEFSQIEKVEVLVAKLNPPLGGKVASSCVSVIK